jgi:hypothetical protein
MPERREFELADKPAPLKRLRTLFQEYGRMGFTLAKLYCHSRLLMMQNYILSCRLRLWDVVFVCFKIQIFLIRFSYGFPLDQCWPVERSLPPLA